MRETWLTNGSVRLFAVEDGEGPALVFLHGGLANHQAVLPLVQPLTDRYRVSRPTCVAAGARGLRSL
jgi:pimeloyl-ACP methyl ester carboxylesterase